MAIGFNIQFRINEKTSSRVIRLTDASSNGGGFTFGKGNFSIVFPDGSTINHTDFLSPDITAIGGSYDFQLPTDIYNNVLTGQYSVTYVVLNSLGVAQTPVVLTIPDFNWIKPTTTIQNKSDVFIPEVQFYDATSYTPVGNFVGSLFRTFSVPYPTNSEAYGQTTPSVSSATLTPSYASKYYEGLYNLSLDVTVNYTHDTYSWLSVYYTNLTTKTYDIRQVPTQTQLVTKLNAFRADVDAYKENNDTQFEIMSENYDIAIALYSHLIARFDTNTLDGSQPLLEELLSILEPYNGLYTYKSTQLTPFTLGISQTSYFTLSDGTNTDNFPLQSTLLFSSGSAALGILVTNNTVTFTPNFGTTNGKFAAGDDSRFHSAVTLGTANGLSLSSQAISLALATSGTSGAMSAADKAKLDGIATGATANLGTVTSVGISMPSAFTVTNSPVTTSGTLTIAGAGTSLQYIKGDGTLGTLNTVSVVESTNLYYTDSRARGAISLTTTGTSGAATYSSATGILNIPQYQGGVTSFNTRTGAIVLSSSDVTTALTFTPENSSNKGIAGGYASLDGTGTVPAAQLPSYVDDVVEYANLASFPATGVTGKIFVALDTNKIYRWSGSTYIEINASSGGGTWGSITGTLSNQTDLATALSGKQGTITLTTVGSTGTATLIGNTLNIPNYSGGTGTVGTISRNVQNFIATAGQTTFTISGGYAAGYIDVFVNGVRLTSVDYAAANGTTVVMTAGLLVGDIVDVMVYTGIALTGTAPMSFNTTTGAISISQATTSTNGYLSSTDWNTFNSKQATISLTTTGSSGSATFITNTLNIPTYTLSGLGGQASSTNLTSLSGLTYVSASFVKMTAANTFSLDTNTYYLASNPSGYTNNTGTVTSVAALTLGTTGTDLTSTVATGTTTPVITLNVPSASATNRGVLTSADWSTFNNKQGTITLTTTGSSGAATFSTNTLNIPNYTLAGLGGQASSTNLTSLSGLTFVSTSFVKMTAAGTFALDTNTYYLASNPSGYTNNTGTVTSVAALTLGTTGTDLSSTVATGTTTPVITLNVPSASATNRGVLTSTDWSTFNGKQGALTLTTTGTSGAATLVGNTLNIPNYASGGGSGTVTTVSVVSANGFAGTVATATSTPAITISTSISGVLKGNGTAISAAVANTDYLAVNNPVYTGTLGTGTLSYTPANLFQYAQQAANSYIQAVFQNTNANPQASTDIVVNNNLSTDTTNYGDFGINSSGFTGSGSLNLPNAIYLTATTGDLVLGTTTANAVRIVINSGTTDAAIIKTTSQLQLPSYTTTTSFSGTVVGYLAFDSSGNVITTAAPTGSGSPAGSTGQLQYNNAGAFGGASNVQINSNGQLLLIDAATPPTTPAAGTMVLYTENHAGKTLPSVMSPTGIDYNLQAALYGTSTYMWLASTGTTVAINWGTSFTALNAGTAAAQSHPTKASTSAITSMNRANFGTGSTATGSSGIVSAATVAWLGNAAGLGGFLFFARFGVETISGTHRVLVGLSANTAALAAEPSTLANTIALGYDSTDTTWQVITRSATTLTKTNTAITITAGQILDLYIHSAPNSQSVQFHIKNGATGADLYVGTAITTNIPSSTTFLSMQAQIQSASGTTAKLLALNRMYLETDI